MWPDEVHVRHVREQLDSLPNKVQRRGVHHETQLRVRLLKITKFKFPLI